MPCSCFSNVVQDLKEIQKLRKRQQGVSAEDLAATKTEKKEEKVEVCPVLFSIVVFVGVSRFIAAH